MVKIDLVTGFLGSGKTTFIKKYAKYLMDAGYQIGILENDFGAVNVDMMLLQDLMGDNCELEMIAGACDEDCHRRRFKTKLISMGMCGYDRVIVEPSGIYEVDEFFDVLCEEPLDRWYEIGNVITIVNAKLEEDLSKEAEYLLACQCANAGKILLSRSKEATAEECARTIAHLNRALSKVECKRVLSAGQSENLPVLQGEKLSAGQSGDVIRKDFEQFTKEDFEQILNSGYVPESYYKKMDVKEGGAFDTLYFMNVKLSEEQLKVTVKKLMQDTDCGHIFRMKGFLKTEEDDWVELNATRHEIRISPIENGQEIIIVIGENLCEDAIAAYLGENSK